MTAQDKTQRYAMCQWFLRELEAHPDLVRLIWFTDEAHFHLNGAVNNHNNIFWGSSPPEEIVEKQLKGKKVTAFVAFNAEHGLLGPYWFEVDGKTATINAERYRSGASIMTCVVSCLIASYAKPGTSKTGHHPTQPTAL